MKYICSGCGHILDEEDLINYTERGEFWGSEFTETVKVCPICKGYVNETTLKCSCCDAYISEDYISTDDGHNYCNNCYRKETIN